MEPNSKKQLKIDKITRKKQSLNQVIKQKQLNNNNYENRQFNSHQNIQNDTEYNVQYIDPQTQLKKSKQWWSNLDRIYFKQLNRRDILLTRNITTSQKLSNYFNYQTQFNGSYFNQQIQSYYINQDEHTLIRVLFRSTFQIQIVKYSCVNYTTIHNRKTNKNKQLNNLSTENLLQNWKIINYHQNQYKKISQQLNYNLQQIVKNINFEFIQTKNDAEMITKICKFQQIKKQLNQNQYQIDLQLKLWQVQIQKLNTKNSILWNTLLSNFIVQQKITKLQKKCSLQQVNIIKQLLTHYTILRYFQYGTKDKTFTMLKALIESMKHIKPLKGRDTNNKKFFQTDCKICFCSFNSDSNQVLYCDMCNTSFHLACYGLNKIPQDKQYFCDCCTYIKKQQKLKNTQIKKITCQICCKANFPIKYVNGHFYHITCLVIFNFSKIFYQTFSNTRKCNETIFKKVIESQLNCSCCIFCTGTQGSESGMQQKCNYSGCEESMHPICAYINGCLFQVKKNMNKKMLHVKIFCNKHDIKRDYIQQSYLRRYMCNFKNTSVKNLQSFRKQYQLELQERENKLYRKGKNNLSLPSLLIDSKNVRRYCSLRQQKQIQKNNQIEMTQTGKMLQKLVKQQN